MAIISVQNVANFAFGFRFDAEYYQPDFLKSRRQIKKGLFLNDLLEDIRYGVQAKPDYLEAGINYIRALNLNSPCIEGEILKIHPSQVPTADYILKTGDILITRSGANCGAVGIITDSFAGATFGSYTIRLRCNHKINPFALFAFLLSCYGRAQTFQIRYGSAQPNLSIPYLRNLISVPLLPEALQYEAEKIIRAAVEVAHSQKRLYDEAEAELLERIQWKKLTKKPVELSYVEKFSEVQKQGRYDAEYFQPQYKRLRLHLRKVGAIQLSDFCSMPNRGVQPVYVEDGEVLVINSRHLGPTSIDIANTEHTSKEFYSLQDTAKAILKQYDVLVYSTGAYVGRTNVYLEKKDAIASNHVTIIRPHASVCNPVYLALFLNARVGIMQSAQFASGSAQRELYPNDLMQFLIYLPTKKNGSIDLEWQKKLADKVIQASKAKSEAQAMLDKAKKTVEDLIIRHH